jgi:hypothetical protein
VILIRTTGRGAANKFMYNYNTSEDSVAGRVPIVSNLIFKLVEFLCASAQIKDLGSISRKA